MNLPPIVLDISAAQDPRSLDLARARDESNVVAVIVRAEYGTKIDAQFHAHIEAVLAANLKAGVYAFQMTDADPQDEVAALVAEIASYNLELGVSLDVETRNNQSPGNVIAWSAAFISETEDARGEPFGMIYTGPGFWNSLGPVAVDPSWAARRLWVANYGVTVPMQVFPWGKWGTSSGPVLHQRYGNTIWSNTVTHEQKWGPASPGASWTKIATAYKVAGCAGEIDVSILPTPSISPLLVRAAA